jgi:predicted DNA-binding transcriptional regulator AlpA
LIRRAGYGKTKIYGLIKKGKFPPQANRLEGNCSAGWYEDEIDAYIESGRDNRSQKWKEVADSVGVIDQVGLPDLTKQWDTPLEKAVIKPSRTRVAKTSPQSEEQGLIATGLQIGGHAVYLHPHSGKLLLDIGRALAPFLSGIAA